jgi:uncharacterized protein YdcH (DUF465 family)
MEEQWDHEQGGPSQVGGVGQQASTDPIEGADPGQGQGPGAAATDSGETIESLVKTVMQRVEDRLADLGQDLDEQITRQVQSFSDRTAHRLSEQQRERLRMLDEVLEGAQQLLGPEEYENFRRRKQLDILVGTPEETPARQEQPRQPQQRQQPTQQQPDPNDFAVAYIQQQGLDPEALTEAEVQRLTSANSWTDWMQRVGELAARRQGGGAQQTPGPGSSQQRRGNPATAQPTGGGAPPGVMTAEQLQAAYNKAAADGDMALMEELGQKIDQLLRS